MDNWFCEKDFNSLEGTFFDDVTVDPSLDDIGLDLENVGLDDIDGESWNAGFEGLEIPMPPMFFGGGSVISLSNSRDSSQLRSKTTKGKGGCLFRTTSPDSVLEVESSNSFSENPSVDPELKFSVTRKRSQRKAVSSVKLEQLSSLISLLSLVNALHESESKSHLAEKHSRKRKKKNNLALRSGDETMTSELQVSRICSHCGITKTPQWREGPNGPKSLCNACGVRYRSGRLLPEYRPAASPTFVPSVHSNSHKKIVEMRKKAEATGKCAEMRVRP